MCEPTTVVAVVGKGAEKWGLRSNTLELINVRDSESLKGHLSH